MMHGSFPSKTYNFTALLGRSSFPEYSAQQVKIPPYQRGFSWAKSHIATFWDDVIEFHEDASTGQGTPSYFMGPIVILREQTHIVLLDGQQRLATATMLLCAIRDLSRASGGQPGSDLARDIQRDLIFVDDETNEYALVLNELDRGYFTSHIQEDPPSKSVKERIRSHRLMRNANNFLRSSVKEHVSGLQGSDLVKELRGLNKTVSQKIKLVAIEVSTEEEAFQIFETLNDRGLHLAVPDLLLNHLMRVASSDEDRVSVRQNWNLLIENIGMRRVSTFLRHMWVSKYGDVKRQGLYKEIRDSLSKGSVESKAFAIECAEESKLYSAIVKVDKDALGKAFTNVELLVGISADRAYPVLLSGIAALSKSDFAKLARNVEALVVRHAIFANQNPSDLEDVLYDAARVIRERRAKGESSAKALVEARKVLKAIDPTSSQISAGVEDVYLNKKQARFVLNRLAQDIQGQSKALKPGRADIEHVFPRNAEKDSWPDLEELEHLEWHLGNLSLIEPKKNKKAANLPFEEKKEIYATSDIKMSADISDSYADWGDEQILHRAKSLVPNINSVWKIS